MQESNVWISIEKHAGPLCRRKCLVCKCVSPARLCVCVHEVCFGSQVWHSDVCDDDTMVAPSSIICSLSPYTANDGTYNTLNHPVPSRPGSLRLSFPSTFPPPPPFSLYTTRPIYTGPSSLGISLFAYPAYGPESLVVCQENFMPSAPTLQTSEPADKHRSL